MTNYPKFEVAISDADRAEIEAIYIELLRERDAAARAGVEIDTLPLNLKKDSLGQ